MYLRWCRLQITKLNKTNMTFKILHLGQLLPNPRTIISEISHSSHFTLGCKLSQCKLEVIAWQLAPYHPQRSERQAPLQGYRSWWSIVEFEVWIMSIISSEGRCGLTYCFPVFCMCLNSSEWEQDTWHQDILDWSMINLTVISADTVLTLWPPPGSKLDRIVGWHARKTLQGRTNKGQVVNFFGLNLLVDTGGEQCHQAKKDI